MFLCPKCQAEISPTLTACPFCGEQSTDFLRRYAVTPLDGKYQLLSMLGIGGMGEVYKAMHVHLHTPRVIKLMRPAISGEKDAHERFLREARLATRIQHPNVAALFDFSALPDGSFYMVWEYIEGTNLQKYVRERRFLRPELAVRLATQALMGLESIHRAGIVHRDVSPENLMVSRDEHGLERIKIIDLGVAKQWSDAQETQTRSGMFVGKFKYCSPEQLGMLGEGERIDGRADVYSFGLVFYEMLTGVAAFQAETPHQYLHMHSSQMPRPLQKANPEANVPPELEALIFRALAKDRTERFNSALEFARALESVLPALPQTVAYSTPAHTVAAATLVEPVAAQPPAPRPGKSIRLDLPPGRKRDLLEQIVGFMGDEHYARADVALQTLKMHLGVHAENDTEFRRVRKEMETAAAEKEAWYGQVIDGAKQEGKPKEVQRLLADREERLGRRFAHPALKLEAELWLRRRAELLAKARNWLTAESFNSAGQVLDDLAAHLERGAASDEDYLALQKSFQDALADASDKMKQEIEAAHAGENIGKARRLLGLYESKFGRRIRKPPAVEAAEAWIRQIDGDRKPGEAKVETTMTRRRIRRRRGIRLTVGMAIPVLAVAAGALAIWRWKAETADFVRQLTSGAAEARLLDMLGVSSPPAVTAVEGPPRLDAAKRVRAGEIWRNPIDQLDYVWIPPGDLEGGCVDGDGDCRPEELPSRKTRVAGFWMGRTEVPAEAFERFVQKTGFRRAARVPGPPLDGRTEPPEQRIEPGLPASFLSLADASAYCRWAGGRLPTEDEWEYAARARSGRSIHSWGNGAAPGTPSANLADESMIAHFDPDWRGRRDRFPDYNDGFATYAPVGSFAPNQLGLTDVEGNVWEWTATARLRGGSFASVRHDVRLSARIAYPPDATHFAVGCRCVLEPK